MRPCVICAVYKWTCYVMLCYVMLCYVMLCYVMLCYVMLCYVMLCYVMLCYVMLCYVMLCYVMLCYVMLCYEEDVVRGAKERGRNLQSNTLLSGQLSKSLKIASIITVITPLTKSQRAVSIILTCFKRSLCKRKSLKYGNE